MSAGPGRDAAGAVIVFGGRTSRELVLRAEQSGEEGREEGDACVGLSVGGASPLVLASRLQRATNYASFGERKERAKSSSIVYSERAYPRYGGARTREQVYLNISSNKSLRN